MINISTDIRNYIINNFKNDKKETLRSAIEGSIEDQDEITLPGMGVFLEIVWQDGDKELQNKILDIIMNRLKKSKND
ncbi:MAG: small acid-soluble spore protein SspI [Bacilli bacterium]|nr:small acid-soluble spore protein SspI [Bacilli bacterium]